ncbi:hypothetical protein CPB86DRAFT_786656 [Serendipita vermifera]|nr:hypothetical protein CPB86DRAFT_786656 [Serendipita vermifera]
MSYDLVPSTIFGVSFFLIFLLNIRELFYKERRTGLKLSTILASLERMLTLSMRMSQALKVDARESWGFIEYQQIAFGVGFMTLIHEQVFIMLCAVTLATRDGEPYSSWIQRAEKDPRVMEKRKEERAWFRRWTGYMAWSVGITQGLQAMDGSLRWPENYGKITWLLYLRFFVNLLSFFLAVGLYCTFHRFREVEGINLAALQRLKLTICLLTFVPLFRSTVSFRTVTLDNPNPISSIGPKVAFYCFQLLPELSAMVITTHTDYRNMCDTDTWGDLSRDRRENRHHKSKFWVVMAYIFLPWKLPVHLIKCALKKRRKANDQEKSDEDKASTKSSTSGTLIESDHEKGVMSFRKSLSRMPSFVIPISRPVTPTDDAQSVWSGNLTLAKSATWTTTNHSLYAQTLGKSETCAPSPIVSDVNFWRPRLPPSLSYNPYF